MPHVKRASSINLVLATYLILATNVKNGYGTETQCYPGLGCFPMVYPWTTLTRPLPPPHTPEQIKVQLYCFIRPSISTRYTVSVWPEISLNGCPYEAAKKTVFIAHGFANNGNVSWMHTLKDNMLRQVDATVCIVDWGPGAVMFNYLQVASNTRIVGAVMARFIQFLHCEQNLRPEHVHLIGHSLGAHVCSYIAKRVSGIGQITALDPAQPSFEKEDKRVRLDKSDAHYVEVIHTNAAPFLVTLGLGMISEYGHVDYYMNGGVCQPGCILPNSTEIKSISDLANYAVELLINLVSCSHGRAIIYYTQVLSDNCTIWARRANLIDKALNVLTFGRAQTLLSSTDPCTPYDCIPLGLNAIKTPARGTFSAETPTDEPFCDDPKTAERIRREIEVKEKKL